MYQFFVRKSIFVCNFTVLLVYLRRARR